MDLPNPTNIPEDVKKSWFSRHMFLGYLFLVILFVVIVALVYYFQHKSTKQTDIVEEAPVVVDEEPKLPSETDEWLLYKNDDYGFSARTKTGVNYDYDWGRFFVSFYPTGWKDFTYALRISPTGGHEADMRLQADVEPVIIGGKKFDKVTKKNGSEVTTTYLLTDKISKWVTCTSGAVSCGGIEYYAQNETHQIEFEKILSTISFYSPTTLTTKDIVYYYNDGKVYLYNPNTQREQVIDIQGLNSYPRISKVGNYLFYARDNYQSLYRYDLTLNQESAIYVKHTNDDLIYTYSTHIFSQDKRQIAISYLIGSEEEHNKCELTCDLRAGVQIYDLLNDSVVIDFQLPILGTAVAWAHDNLFVTYRVWEGPTDFIVMKTDGTRTNFTRDFSGIFSPDMNQYLDMGGLYGYGSPSEEVYLVDTKSLVVNRILNDQEGRFAFTEWLGNDSFEYILLPGNQSEEDYLSNGKIYSYNLKTKLTKLIGDYVNDSGVIRTDSSPGVHLVFNQRLKEYYLLVNGKQTTNGKNIILVYEQQ